MKDSYLAHSTGGQGNSLAYISTRNFPSLREVVSSSTKVLQETYFWSALHYHRSRETQVATKAGENFASVDLSSKQPNSPALLGEGWGKASPLLYNAKGTVDLWTF